MIKYVRFIKLYFHEIIILKIILLVFVAISCHSEEKNIETIDYDILEEIQLTKISEIGEDDEYWPGELRQMVVMEDNTILASDRIKNTIEQFSPEGKHQVTIAEEGEGPGELPPHFVIIYAGNSTLGVWNSEKRQLDFFERGGDGLYIYIRSVIDNSFSNHRLDLIGSTSTDVFFAITGQPDWEFMSVNNPDYRRSPVATVDKTLSVIQDSLYMLQTPNYIFGDPAQYSSRMTIGDVAFLGMPPYRYQDRFVLMDDGRYVLARSQPDSASFLIYSDDHRPVKTISLNVKVREVLNSDFDYAFRTQHVGNDNNIRKALESRTGKIKPPFLNVWASKDVILLHTDTNERGKQMVVIDMEGLPAGTFYMPNYDDIQYFKDHLIYTIHKNPEVGHSIRIYQLDL